MYLLTYENVGVGEEEGEGDRTLFLKNKMYSCFKLMFMHIQISEYYSKQKEMYIGIKLFIIIA